MVLVADARSKRTRISIVEIAVGCVWTLQALESFELPTKCWVALAAQ